MQTTKIRAQQTDKRTALAWAFGGISVGIKNNLLSVWILYYYNQVLGIDGILVSLALAIALVFDAFSDPLIGVWSDRTISRWGLRHPFMYAAIIPFTLSYYFILQDPGDATKEEIFTRLLLLMLIMRMSMTFYEVPRNALAPELSKDYDQRSKLTGLNSAFGWFGGAGISAIMAYFFLGDSYSNAAGYHLLGFYGGLGLFIGTVVTTLGTHRNIPDLYKPVTRKIDLTLFFREIKETLANKNWAILFASGSIYALVVGTDTGAGNYYNNFLWEFRPEQTALFAIFGAASVIVVSIAAPALSVGRSKKRIALGVFMCAVVVGPLPIFLRLIDPYFSLSLFPANGSTSLWWILLVHFCASQALAALGFVYVASMSMEIVEQVQEKTGRREEGLLGTANSMMQKLIAAGGTLLAGMIVSISGFDDPLLDTETKVAAAIATFSWIHIAIGFFLPLLSTILIAFYDIERTDHLDRVNKLGYAEQ